MPIKTSVSIVTCSLLLMAGCGGGACPTPKSSAQSRELWETELNQRTELKLDASKTITIKRDVRNIVVGADAGKIANAFHDVMRDDKRHFGLIKVDREQANIGKPFTKGERFQGRYEIDEAIRRDLKPWAKKIFGELVDDPGVQSFVCSVENKSTSDYGVIAELEFSPKEGQPYVLAYHYLSGSPIAGSSTFLITQVSPGVSQITQIFEYQEQTTSFALFFSAGGLTLHNQVVFNQAAQAAEFIGAKVISSDLPEAYRKP